MKLSELSSTPNITLRRAKGRIWGERYVQPTRIRIQKVILQIPIFRLNPIKSRITMNSECDEKRRRSGKQWNSTVALNE